MSRVNTTHLIDNFAILQGEDYLLLVEQDVIKIPGDWTTGTPRGDLRDNTADKNGLLYAQWQFEASTFDGTDTILHPFLDSTQTVNAPATKYREGQTPNIKLCLVTDFEVELPSGVVGKTPPIFVQVVGEITRDGGSIVPLTETFLKPENNLSDVTDPAAARENLQIVGGVKPDWNAVPGSNEEILNQPDLSIYAETTAVNLALDGKENADPTILKEADIGVAIQPFNLNTVVDSEYATVKNTAQSALQPEALNNTALTGIPTAPTAPEGTDTTQIATTAFVLANSSAGGLANPVDVVYQSIQTVTYNDGGNSTLDNSTHNTFTLVADGTGTTIAHSNVPLTGNRYGFELHLTWTSGTITWPASWTKGDSPPTAVGSYVITGVTIDGGTSWKIAILAE